MRIVSGAADSVITFWEDCTEEQEKEKESTRAEMVLKSVKPAEISYRQVAHSAKLQRTRFYKLSFLERLSKGYTVGVGDGTAWAITLLV